MTITLAIIWFHFIADFIFQSDKMAINKSKSFKWLTLHVLVYSLIWWPLFGWKYAAINFALHWLIDFITSRVTSWFWKHEKRHWFFVVIGADQVLHLTCLFATLQFAENNLFKGC